MSHAPNQSFTLEPHARFRVHQDEGIFVLQDAGEVLVVNEVGAFIVEQLRQHASLQQTAEALANTFNVGVETALVDATRLAQELVQAGALTEA